MDVFERISREGFPRERVEAVMHQIELDAAVVTTQFGLYTGFGSFSTWVHDGDDLASALNRSFRTFSRVETPPRLAFASRARRDDSTPRPRARRSLMRKRSSPRDPTEKSGFYR